MKSFYSKNSIVKYIYSFSLILFFSAFLLTGCSKKDDGPSNPNGGDNPGGGGNNNNTSTMTLNGGGYNNKTISFLVSTAAFSPNDNVTVLSAGASTSDTVTVVLYIPGNKTGEFNFNGTNGNDVTCGIVLNFYGNGVYSDGLISKGGAGSIKVTAYGNVGGNISGTISGTLVSVLTQKEVTISGSFTAKRAL